VNFFGFLGDWISHVTGSSSVVIAITEVDIIPVTFERSPFLVDLFIDISNLGIGVISRESIGWFRNIFMFNIVNSKSSISHSISLGPIAVFGDTS
jgi:hypothetical protein